MNDESSKPGKRPSGTGKSAHRPADRRGGPPPKRKAAPREATGGGDSPPSRPSPPGLEARRLAVHLIEGVLTRGHALDTALASSDGNAAFSTLEARDRGFARLIAATVLRHLGSLDAVIAGFLERPLPATSYRPRSILQIAAAQILYLGTPAHAAINLAVEQCRRDPRAERYAGLANAVLRRLASDGPRRLADLPAPRTDIPDWIWRRWCAAYGDDIAAQIAAASLTEAALDLSARSDAADWATRLGGQLLDTGSIRLAEAGRIEDLPGFAEGAWWVQDAAASLPVRLLGDVAGLSVADFCAAPGGKTAALAAAGANVTAVDQSEDRIARLRENVDRLQIHDRVTFMRADISRWRAGSPFDAVLLDAPCLSTGTIRRHPDLMHLKRSGDLARIVAIQAKLLARAAAVVRPGGRLLYCVCSLEPEEGEGIVEAFLSATPDFRRVPITATEVAGHGEWLTPTGDLRTFPHHTPGPGAIGMDGFYAARMERTAAH